LPCVLQIFYWQIIIIQRSLFIIFKWYLLERPNVFYCLLLMAWQTKPARVWLIYANFSHNKCLLSNFVHLQFNPLTTPVLMTLNDMPPLLQAKETRCWPTRASHLPFFFWPTLIDGYNNFSLWLGWFFCFTLFCGNTQGHSRITGETPKSFQSNELRHTRKYQNT